MPLIFVINFKRYARTYQLMLYAIPIHYTKDGNTVYKISPQNICYVCFDTNYVIKSKSLSLSNVW